MKRFLLYMFTYILVTVSVAFGTVTIDDLINKGGGGNSGPSSVVTEPETAGDKLLNNLMSIGGAELDLSIELFDTTKSQQVVNAGYSLTNNRINIPDIVILFNGNLNISNLEDIKANGDIKVVLDGKEINMFIAFLNNTLYLSNDTLSISKKMGDISELFDLLPLLGLDLDLGIELDGNAMASLMGSLQNIKETELDDGQIKLQLNLLDIITLDIYCDKEYNVKSINANDFNIANYKINLNAGLNKKNDIVIENPAESTEKEYVDITKTLNIVDSVKEIMSNKKLHLNLDMGLLDSTMAIGVNGDVDVDFSDGILLGADLGLNLGGTIHKLKLSYINSTIYVDLNGVRFKFDEDTIAKTIDVITNKIDLDEVEKNILIEIGKIIPNFDIKKVLAGNWKDINIDNLLEFSKGEDNVVNITIFGNAMKLDFDIKLSIILDENEQFSSLKISGIKVLNKEITALIKYSNVVNIPEVDDLSYPNIDNLPKFVGALITTSKEIASEKIVKLNVSTSVNFQGTKIDLTGKVRVDFNNQENIIVYAEVNVKILNKIIPMNILFENDTIYLTIENLKFKATINELDLLVKEVQSVVNDSTISNLVDGLKEILYGTTTIVQLINGNISALPNDLIKILGLTENQSSIVINKNLLNAKNDISLKLNYDTKINGITLETLDLNIFEIRLDCGFIDNFDIPNIEYNTYESLGRFSGFIKSALNTITKINTNKNFAFNIASVINIKKDILDKNNVLVKTNDNTITVLDTSKILINLNDVIKKENDNTFLDVYKLAVYINIDIKLDTITKNYVNGVVDEASTKNITSNHKFELKLINGTFYIKFDKMNIKLSVDGINYIIDSICEMMGLEVDSNSFANLVDILLNAKQNENVLGSLSFEMIKHISLSNRALDIIADLSELKLFKDLAEVDLGLSYNESEIEKLSIRNINTQNINISNIDILFANFEEISDYNETEKNSFINLSTIGKLLESINDTMSFKDFNVKGNVELKLNAVGIKQNFNIPVDANLKVVENNLEGKIVLGPIPVVAGVNDDAPYIFGNTVSGGSPGKNRVLTIYIKDDFVYMYRKELVPVFASADKLYEKKLKVHFDTFADDIMFYLLKYGLGLSDKIMGAIIEALNFQRTAPIDLSNILMDYSLNQDLYSLKLNLREITGNPQLDYFSLGLKVTDYLDEQTQATKPIIGALTVNMFMPVAKGVEITLNSNDLHLENIGSICDLTTLYDYVNTYIYKEGAAWDAYNGDWNLSSQRKFTVNFVTNSTETFPNIEGIAGTSCVIPTPRDFQTDDGIKFVSNEFAGWYTTDTFEVGSEYSENVIPRTNLTLYAKWNSYIKSYVTISFVTNGGAPTESMKVLEGSEITLPTYHDLLVENNGNNITTKQFAGWFLDEKLTLSAANKALQENYTLYAKWTVIDTENALTLTVYDNDEKLLTKYLFENDNVVLTGSSKFNSKTIYYTDKSFQNEFTSMKMPNQDLTLYVKNEYSVHTTSKYGNILDTTNNYYQGVSFALPKQQNYFEDDGTKTERILYTFNGYFYNGQKIQNIENFVMPNTNVEIVADWGVQIKHYYTVTFNMALNYVPKLCVSGCSYATPPQQYESVRILEGEVLDLSPYQPKCKINAGIFGIKYDYIATTWGTTIHKDLTNGGDGVRSIVITSDTVLYPYWEKI